MHVMPATDTYIRPAIHDCRVHTVRSNTPHHTTSSMSGRAPPAWSHVKP